MNRDVFQIIGDIQGTIHARIGRINGKHNKVLTEAEEIKKKWQEYTEKLYKRCLNDTNSHHGVITDLELDILECEVKWALGSIITNQDNGGDRIPDQLFKS